MKTELYLHDNFSMRVKVKERLRYFHIRKVLFEQQQSYNEHVKSYEQLFSQTNKQIMAKLSQIQLQDSYICWLRKLFSQNFVL